MRRIIVRQQARSPDESLLRAVAAVAARLDTEISGLFIEDIDLLNLAGMPFAAEVCFPAATRRCMDVASTERSLRGLADRARRALESIAQEESLRTSFRVARGSPLAEMLAAAAESDVVITASATRMPRDPAFTILCQASVAPTAVGHLLQALKPLLRGDIALVLLGTTPEQAGHWEVELRQSLDDAGLAHLLRVLCPVNEAALEPLFRTQQGQR